MDPKLAIITLSTLAPAFAVGFVLRGNGKTLNFSIFGGTLVWVVSVLLIYAGFYLANVINMPIDALILFLPIAIAGVFYFLLKGMKTGNER